MNRKDRRANKKLSRDLVAERPDKLTPVPRQEWPPAPLTPDAVWVSKRFLVQMFRVDSPIYPDMIRLSICRVTLNTQGRWQDDIPWTDLQAIKREVGYGDWYAVEVYPPDEDVVNVANMRHLWMVPIPLAIGWRKKDRGVE